MQESNDNLDSKKVRSPLKQMIYWWEGRRLFYNLIVLVPTSLFYGAIFNSESDKVGIQFLKYFITINIFYTFAWIFGWVYHQFFNAPYESTKTRWLVFFMGVFFGMIIINLPVLTGI